MNIDWKKIYAWPAILRYLLIGLICAVIFEVGYEYDLVGLKHQLVLSQQQEKNLQQETKNLFYHQVLLEELAAQFPEVKRVFIEWQEKFIKPTDLNQLLAEIRAIGKANKLQFILFDPLPETYENNYLKQPFHVIVLGDYVKTANFIHQVAKLPWIVVIGDFTLSWLALHDADKSLSTELTLYVYHLRGLKK